MMVNVRDTETGEIVARNSVDAREMCAQADGRYEMAPTEAPAPVVEEDEIAAEPAAVEKPSGPALIEAVCDAIDNLDEVEDYNANGEPSLLALQHALGYSVTADERTEAWTDYQIAQKEIAKAAAKAAAKG